MAKEKELMDHTEVDRRKFTLCRVITCSWMKMTVPEQRHQIFTRGR